MQSKNINPYSILNLSPDADREMLETAYRRLALRYHPDLNPSRDATFHMQRINEAYALLCASLAGKTRPATGPATAQNRPQSTAKPSPPPSPAPPTATPKEKPVVARPVEQMVVFYLDDQSYGFPFQDIETVLGANGVAPHPHMPSFIDGVVRAREQQVPVVDLRRHLGVPVRPVNRDSRTLLVRLGETPLGFLVDTVDHYLQVPSTASLIPPSFPMTPELGFIKGFVRIGFQLVVLLHLPGLISRQQQTVLDGFFHYLNTG